MDNPIAVAFIRAFLGGIISFGSVCLTTFQVTDDWEDAIIAGAVAGLSYLSTRGGFEGLYDQDRDSKVPPAVSAGDVGVK